VEGMRAVIPYLTEQERRVYDFIVRWRRLYRVSPTLQEIADKIDYCRVKSRVTVLEQVRLLEEKGWLQDRAGGKSVSRKWVPSLEAVAHDHVEELLVVMRRAVTHDAAAQALLERIERDVGAPMEQWPPF